MQRSTNIVLIGPMGAGKSTIGRRLAALLGRRFVDLDDLIEERTGVSIPLIFELEGESRFRHRESDLLAEALQWPDLVLATGGGCVLLPGNRECLRSQSYVIYLRTSVAVQLQRLSRDRKRPLLQTPDRRQRLEKMAIDRDPLYLAVADYIVDSIGERPAKLARDLAKHLIDSDVVAAPTQIISPLEHCL